MSGPIERRAFCLNACRALSGLTVASTVHGCGGDTPTAPSQPPVTTTPPSNPPPPENPPPTNPPPTNPPPANPSPPPPSPIVTMLPIVPAAIVQGNALTVTIDSASPLATLWGAGLAQVVSGGIQRSILLARVGPEAFTALNGVCTHEGCVVSRYASPIFVCPCHGSRYDTNGTVVQGPAPAALPRLSTEFSSGVLTIRL